jgi:hypothetical protein
MARRLQMILVAVCIVGDLAFASADGHSKLCVMCQLWLLGHDSAQLMKGDAQPDA